jgi:hypothetical protein
MKKTAIAVSAIVALLLVGGTAVVLANQGTGGLHNAHQACSRYTIGENLPLGALTGRYYNATSYKINGKANGTFTFQVSQAYASGCVLSITGGTFFIGATSYSVTGGTVLMGKGGLNGNGWGTTSGGSFLFSISGLHGNSTKANAGAIQLDFKNGASEFLVQLHSWTPWARR